MMLLQYGTQIGCAAASGFIIVRRCQFGRNGLSGWNARKFARQFDASIVVHDPQGEFDLAAHTPEIVQEFVRRMHQKLSQRIRIGTDRAEAQRQHGMILHEALEDSFVAPDILRRRFNGADRIDADRRRECTARYGHDIARFVTFAGNGFEAIGVHNAVHIEHRQSPSLLISMAPRLAGSRNLCAVP